MCESRVPKHDTVPRPRPRKRWDTIIQGPNSLLSRGSSDGGQLDHPRGDPRLGEELKAPFDPPDRPFPWIHIQSF